MGMRGLRQAASTPVAPAWKIMSTVGNDSHCLVINKEFIDFHEKMRDYHASICQKLCSLSVFGYSGIPYDHFFTKTGPSILTFQDRSDGNSAELTS